MKKWTEKVRKDFLKHYSEMGVLSYAAAEVGVVTQLITNYRQEHPEFAEEMEEARQVFCKKLESAVHKRVLNGVPEPIIGGKNRDIIITHVPRFSDRLTEIMLKRHIAEFRDQSTLDVNVKQGGVLLIGPQKSEKEWEDEHGDT